MSSRDYFQGKRIAVIGLGPHGEMIADVKFLIKAGALVAVYDLRSEARLKSHLVFLRSIGLANYVCGPIPAEDLLDMDLIILSHEYPRTSNFLKPLKDKGIKVEYPETLFFRLAPPVTVVGVMGACGKATVMSMLAPMLEIACKGYDNQGLYVIDPEEAGGTLAHLSKIKSSDVLLIRIVDEMMKELYEMRMSPHVAIFTTIPVEGAYTNLPFDILSYQTYNNFIIANDEIIDATHALKFQQKAKMLRTRPSLVPADWQIQGKGAHDRENAALAFQAAKLFKISDDAARDALESWKPLRGRLEAVKKVRNVEFYNDSASISPYSTIKALQILSKDKNAVLIFGGAGGGRDYGTLYSVLPQFAHSVVLLPGSGTITQREKLQKLEGVAVYSAASLEDAVRLALEHSQKGDRVLFSPGFEAAGFDRTRAERGERFVKAVRAL